MRSNLGTVSDPVKAGNLVRIDGRALTASGTALDLAGITGLSYAVFRMSGDLPVSTPSFSRSLGSGVTVTSPAGGAYQINIPSSFSALLSGRDWHVLRMLDTGGEAFDLFEGLIVSTRALSF